MTLVNLFHCRALTDDLCSRKVMGRTLNPAGKVYTYWGECDNKEYDKKNAILKLDWF